VILLVPPDDNTDHLKRNSMSNASESRTKGRQTSRLTSRLDNRKPYPLTINDEISKQRILTALADPYSRRIMSGTTRKPLSALELSEKYEIPKSTTYRRIEELTQSQLLVAVKPSRTKNGKWFDVYRCLVTRIGISSKNGALLIGIANGRPKYQKCS
jgi:hypothetical protein